MVVRRIVATCTKSADVATLVAVVAELASFLVPEAEGAKERTQGKRQVDLTLPRTHVCDPFRHAKRARDDGQSSTTSACSCAWRFD